MANTKRKSSASSADVKRRAKEEVTDEEHKRGAGSSASAAASGGRAFAVETPAKLSAAEQRRRAKEWFERGGKSEPRVAARPSSRPSSRPPSGKRKASANASASPAKSPRPASASAEAQRQRAREWAMEQGINVDSSDDEDLATRSRQRPSTPRRKYSDDSRKSASSQHVISDDDDEDDDAESLDGSGISDDDEQNVPQVAAQPISQPSRQPRKSLLNRPPERVSAADVIDSPPAQRPSLGGQRGSGSGYNFGPRATHFVKDDSFHTSFNNDAASQFKHSSQPSSAAKHDPAPVTPVKQSFDEDDTFEPSYHTRPRARTSVLPRIAFRVVAVVVVIIAAYFAWRAALQRFPNFHLDSIIRERCCGMQTCTGSDIDFEIPYSLFQQIQSAPVTEYDAYPVSQTAIRVTASRLRSVEDSVMCSVGRVSRYLLWALIALVSIAALTYRWKTSNKRSELMLEQSYDIAESVKAYLKTQSDPVPIDFCQAHILDQATGNSNRKYITSRWPYVCKVIQSDPRIREFTADMTTGTHRVWQFMQKPSFADSAETSTPAQVFTSQSSLY